MMFTLPTPEELKNFSVAGINDLVANAKNAKEAITASATAEAITDEQLEQAEKLKEFLVAAATELKDRQDKAARLAAAAAEVEMPAEPAPAETVTASAQEAVVEPAEVFDAAGNKVVTASTQATTTDTVVEATITAAGATQNAPRRSVGIADAAPYSPAPDVKTGDESYTIIAAADIATFPMGSELTYKTIGKAFEERVRSYPGTARSGAKARMQHSLATIRRNYPENQVILEGESQDSAYAKLKTTSDTWGRNRREDAESLVAANGWCAPSEPDYSICNPITTDGLLNLPEMVLRRGGLLHNQGLDFSDFFGNDFVLPIPGYNILTEAQVIADTAKTCVEIPCPEFVDDRLNVAALCLTGSLLQNRGYPEFVSEFVQGAVAAMAHLVNREVVNEIETGSTAVLLSGVDPWVTDGTVWSQIMSAVDMIAINIRSAYRASRTQMVEIVMPQWIRGALRADWIRRNATHTEDLADAMINAAYARRNVRVQEIYDWQDAFDPANGAGAIDVNHQIGNVAGPIAAALMTYPTSVTFLAFLPGTWVLGRQDVIRLDTVYDSTLLAQNQVTQLFVEDGFKPMRMCQISRAYTVNICPSGSTGVQRAVACADVTP
jgi:hypothetical protein